MNTATLQDQSESVLELHEKSKKQIIEEHKELVEATKEEVDYLKAVKRLFESGDFNLVFGRNIIGKQKQFLINQLTLPVPERKVGLEESRFFGAQLNFYTHLEQYMIEEHRRAITDHMETPAAQGHTLKECEEFLKEEVEILTAKLDELNQETADDISAVNDQYNLAPEDNPVGSTSTEENL